MARITLALLSLCLTVVSARMAYQFSDGIETVLRGRLISETFSCEGRRYGYYADIANNCQIFHICLPVTDFEGAVVETDQFSFFCNNNTIFDQESLTCNYEEEAVPCEAADTLFELSNAEFGVIPEDDDLQK